jgi:hypothetical protein
VDGHHPTTRAGGAGLAERADAAGGAEAGPPTATAGWADRDGDPGRAGDGAGLEIEAELVLGEAAAGCGGNLGFDHWREPLLVEPGQVGAGAIGAVARDHRLGDLPTALGLWGEVVEQPRRDHRIAGGGHRDLGRADDLAIGIHRDVGLVAVKAMGGGLVAVTGLGSTVEITRSGAVPSKIRKRPSLVSSMSWPVTVANSAAASAVRGSKRSPRRA